jgi:hypothetical protein
MRRVFNRLGLLFVCLSFYLSISSAQQNVARQIATPISEAQRVVLEGNTHPLAQVRFDQGIAPPDLRMERMLLVLRRSPEQEVALSRLLDEQLFRTAPKY